jgi:hypothetical protein
MKTMILLCAAAIFAGCAHQDEDNRGRPANRMGFETGTHADPELPYRMGPGQNRTDRDMPTRGNSSTDLPGQ